MLYIAWFMLSAMAASHLWDAATNPNYSVLGRFVGVFLAFLSAVGAAGVWRVM